MPVALLLILCGVPVATDGTDPSPRSVVIFSPAEHDRRIDATRQAIDFWNETFSRLNLPRPFLAPEVKVSPSLSRALQTYAMKISKDGWHLQPGADGLEPPIQVTSIAGDILVLLSTERLLSFAWPIAAETRYLVAIRSDQSAPLDVPSVARNVVAHELGHTLGLIHNGGPQMLMCGSCDMTVADPKASLFLPLTSDDRARLAGRGR